MVRNGRRSGLLRFRCKECSRQFQSKHKPQRLNLKLFKEYALGKQTLSQLSKETSLTLPTLQKHLDKVAFPRFKPSPRPIILVLDATYFGSKEAKDGLLVGKDWLTKEIVYYKFIESESKAVFSEVRDTLEKWGYTILGVVVDGRPGVKSAFSGIPIQMCQFHQIQIVNRYLTKSPKLISSLQLKTLIEDLSSINQYGFRNRFNYYLEVNGEFINEKTLSPETGRQVYKHKRLRSAVNSIRNNLPYLFTYQENLGPGVIGKMPNTTNSLDGWFAHLKKLLNCHNGLRKDRRHRVIEYILSSRFFN